MVQIKSLPKTQRDVIVSKIKEIKGLTQRQTARILGISPNLIFKALKEAREPSLCFCATCASSPGSKRTVPLLPCSQEAREPSPASPLLPFENIFPISGGY
jgi:transcriptional regulator with XRE-family HTH domain